MADETPQTPEPAATPGSQTAPRGLRLRGLIGVWMLIALLIAAAWQFAPDRSVRSVAVFWSILPLGLLLSIFWWTFFSGLSWGVRRFGLVVLALLIVGGLASLRVEDFEGDMFPRFAFRWQATAEEQAAAHRAAVPFAPEIADTTTLEITADDWPVFRGHGRDGVEPDVHLKRDFATAPPRELWRHPVGLGWGSFAIVGDLCWTQEQVGEEELVTCYQVSTGLRVWEHADQARFTEALGGDGPRATPTVHDGRVYTVGGTGILNCLDALTGEKVWSTNILEDAGAENITWAMSASPLIVDDTVIVNPGGGAGRAVIAYDSAKGDVRWSAGDQPASYAGLRLETVLDQPQLILYDGNGVAGLDPADGGELWRFEWENGPKVNAAQPILRDGRLVFISSSYSLGSALLEVSQTDDAWSVEPRWTKKNFFKLKFNDGVYRDGFLYGLDESYLSCIEFETGKRRWKARSHTGYGQLILLGETLVIQAESGELVFADATPEKFVELHRMPALDGKTWNNPAYSRGRLLLRNAREAVCLELSLEAGIGAVAADSAADSTVDSAAETAGEEPEQEAAAAGEAP